MCSPERSSAGVYQGRRGPTSTGIEPTVGSVGDSGDNALAETINGLCKTEVIRRDGPWRGREVVE